MSESPMVIYVALIAILNLGLGYALALYLGAGRAQLTTATVSMEPLDDVDSDVTG